MRRSKTNDEETGIKRDINPICTMYQSQDGATGMDELALRITHALDRDTQLLNPRLLCRLRNIREAALRLHELSVSMDVNASPVARVPGDRKR